MSFDMNNLPHITDQLRMYKKKAVLDDAALTAELNTFAHTGWGENFITAILAGRMKPADEQATIFARFLTLKFFVYNSSA